jgi:hypothetical protein
MINFADILVLYILKNFPEFGNLACFRYNKAMTKRKRTILFSVCLFLFLIAAPSAIFYSQGYRLDFAQRKIVQTGAFYFKVSPPSAQIYINGKLKKKTALLLNSARIENLLPKNYEVEIKKEGYYSWRKNLKIEERMVTEAKNVILFPKTTDFKMLTENQNEIDKIISEIQKKSLVSKKLLPQKLTTKEIRGFELSPDSQKIAYFTNYEIWVLYLQDQYDQPRKKAGEDIFLTRLSEKIGKVLWLTNHYLIFSAGNKIKVAEIDDRDRINMMELAEFKEPEIFWDKDRKNLYVLSQKTLYLSESLLK